jgi:hypothetical protein
MSVSNNSDETSRPGVFEGYYQIFLNYLQGKTEGERQRYAIASLVLAAVLMTLSSLTVLVNLNDLLMTIITVLIGFPAGVILFLNAVGFVHFSAIGNWRIFGWKDRTTPPRRIRAVSITVIIIIIVLIIINSRIPEGIGGAIVVLTALSGFNIVRRTPEELRLARLGLPDPRDIEDDSFDTSYEEAPVYYEDEDDTDEDDEEYQEEVRR